MNEWIDEKGDTRHRSGMYEEILNQYFRYLGNVMYQIGGIHLSQVKEGTGTMKPAQPLPRSMQKNSLNWILRELRNCTWINAPELTENFDLHTNSSSKIAFAISKSLLTTIPQNVTLASHIAKEKDAYTIREYYDDLYAGVFASTIQGRKLTLEDKILQRAIIDAALKEVEKSKKGNSFFTDKTANVSSLPSMEEIEAYGLAPELNFPFTRARLMDIEEQYGKGSVAAICLKKFGEMAPMFQDEVKINVISEIPAYQTKILKKTQALVKSKLASAHRDDKAHYELLLLRVENMLKN